MTFAPAPAMAGPALLTPEEEERLRQYQSALAAPPPPPAPVGSALEAVAPAPQPAPSPVGPALQTVAPSAPANPPPAAYILPSILASGGHISQEVFDSLTSVEQQYLRDLRRAAPQGVAPGSDLAKQFESYAKGLRDSTPQTYSFPDGSTVNMIGGQQISRPADPKASPAEIQQDELGRFIAIDRATGVARVVTDAESGSPVMAKPRISEENRVLLNQYNLELQKIESKLQQLNAIPDGKYATMDEAGNWIATDSWGGSKYRDEEIAKLKEQARFTIDQIKKRDPSNNPTATASPSASPSPTPSPFKSADEVRAAVRSGQIARAAAIEILRTQFQYK